MTNNLTNPEKCILLRSGVEIWLSKVKADTLVADLCRANPSKMIYIENQLVNTTEIIGVFDPIYMEEMRKRRRGQWKCKYGEWHNRFEDCECGSRPPKWKRKII